MHYRSDAFAIDPLIPTISANDGSTLSGIVFTDVIYLIVATIIRIDLKSVSFLQTDILKLNRMYGCNPGDCWDDDIRNGNCPQLAASGQCQSNPVDLFDKCTKSCQFCGLPQPVPIPDPNCMDANDNCPYWANTGECQGNPGYMNTYCRKSCKLCTACEDLYQDCPTRAASGDCQQPATATFMATFCKRSCLICA